MAKLTFVISPPKLPFLSTLHTDPINDLMSLWAEEHSFLGHGIPHVERWAAHTSPSCWVVEGPFLLALTGVID
jgi:hypothetical protein